MPMEYYLLIAGIVLMAVELAVPGFGIFGIASMICLTVGGYFIMGGGLTAMLAISGFYLVLALAVAVLCLYLPSESRWNPFVLWEKQDGGNGQEPQELLGKRGVTLTVLRPSGTVLVEGRRLDVSSLGDYVPRDVPVRIVRLEGRKIFVDEVKE